MLSKKQLYAKKRYQENKERLLAYAKNWHAKNRERANARKAQRRRERGEVTSEYKKRERTGTWYPGKKYPLPKLKPYILEVYGKVCACCGESEPLFLTVDHINNDGHKERNTNGRKLSSRELYAKLLKQEKRKDIQILCMNCNTGKQNNGGICPHQRQKLES